LRIWIGIGSAIRSLPEVKPSCKARYNENRDREWFHSLKTLALLLGAGKPNDGLIVQTMFEKLARSRSALRPLTSG
jgi:hypothetical protein